MKRSSLLIGQEQQAEFRDGYACRQTSNWRYAVPFGSIIFTTIHVIRPSSFIEPSHHRPVPVTRHVNSAVDRSTELFLLPSFVPPLSLSREQTTGRFPSESVERNAEEPWHWLLPLNLMHVQWRSAAFAIHPRVGQRKDGLEVENKGGERERESGGRSSDKRGERGSERSRKKRRKRGGASRRCFDT